MPDDKQTMALEYFDNPLETVKAWFAQAETAYEGIKGRIKVNRGHYALQSSHIQARKAFKRPHVYFPMLQPAVSGNVDFKMNIIRTGDPTIHAEPVCPEQIDQEEKDIRENNCNIIERYFNSILEPDYADIHNVFDSWFTTENLDPFVAMRVEPMTAYRDDVYYEMREEQLFGITVDYKVERKKRENVPHFPYLRFTVMSPEDVRIDMFRRRWQDWRYFFWVESLSHGELMAQARRLNWDMKNVEQVIKSKITSKKSQTEHINYGRISPDLQLDAEGFWVAIRGFTRIWNEENGRLEIRQVGWIDGADDDIAVLYEEPYPHSRYCAPFIISGAYPLPGETAYLSTADLVAGLQDWGNEAGNQSWEAGEAQISPPLIKADVFATRTTIRPRAQWRMDKGAEKFISPANAVHQLIPTNRESPMFVNQSAILESINNIAGTTDVLTGAKYSFQRKEKTLGKERMIQEAGSNKLARQIARDVDYIEILINHGWDILKDELWAMRQRGEVETAAEEVQSIFRRVDMLSEQEDYSRIDILDTPVRLGMPYVRTFISRITEREKINDTYRLLAVEDQSFALTHPRGIEELRRRVLEVSDIPNSRLILEADSQVQQGGDMLGQQFNQPQLMEAA